MSSRKHSRPRPTPREVVGPSMKAVMRGAATRRALLAGGGAAALGLALGLPRVAKAAPSPSSLTFAELVRAKDANDHWPARYSRQILLRWGDPILPGTSGAFDPEALTGAEQSLRFGYNCDFTAYLPFRRAAESSSHGLLFVNHEYVVPYLMFRGMTADDYRARMTDEQIRVLKSALGASVVEVKRSGAGGWEPVLGAYNRRITLDTPIRLAGPCAGRQRMRTSYDPSGRLVRGTTPNCNGGVTPWGTVLSGEEGAYDFFAGDWRTLRGRDIVKRQGWDENDNDEYALSRIEPRFRFEAEPNEWNRFDWVVEVDPYDPQQTPVKRTALGRFTHEGAQCALAPDGRCVVFMGDDDDFEYVYRFVTARVVDLENRAANRNLLDEGVLSVARFEENGQVIWRRLVWGDGPLTQDNGFRDQADVLFETRRAADLLGATPMDDAEGFIANLAAGRCYMALTENEDRLPAGAGPRPEQVNAANPRGPNPDGHILELIPPGPRGEVDWAADRFDWQVMVLCGDPEDPESGALYHPRTSAAGWFTDPDNLGADGRGRLWITTDGPPPYGYADAVYAMDTTGPGRALPKLFYIPPVGSEACSPWFTPDDRTLFIAVQHPGEVRMNGKDATSIAEMDTAWPDFAAGMPARPSVVVLTQESGDIVGS